MKENFKLTMRRLWGFAPYLLVIAVIAFVSFLFPNKARFKYEFLEGQVWPYEDLVAPFDFTILKPANDLEKEIEELSKDFSPYYQMDFDICSQLEEKFNFDFNSQLTSIGNSDQFPDVSTHPNRYKNYAVGLLNRIYENGIIQLDESHENRGRDFVINLVKGNTTHKHTVENLQTANNAWDLITDSLPYSGLPEADYLLHVFSTPLPANIFFNDTLTNRFKQEVLSNVTKSSGVVKKGEFIVTKGSVISPPVYQKLVSYKTKYESEITSSQTPLIIFLGYLLLTSLIIGTFIMYLKTFHEKILKSLPRLAFIMMWFVIFSYLVYAVEKTGVLSAYIIPFCIVPIIVKTFYTDRLAFFTHVVNILIASFLSSLGYEFTFLQILAGIVAVLTRADARNWSQFFVSMLSIFVTYTLAYFGLSLIVNGNISDIDWQVFAWLFLSTLFTLLAFPLIPLLSRVFGFTTSLSLMELSDMNRPLLQKLALEAPGTLQHSLQVGNLAEAAARAIGADQLLVKVGAYYHDIGKTNRPEYFIENQSGNNPHDEKSNLESAQIIIDHVTDGEVIAKKYRLPRVLIDFILTHHGTTRVEYFYRNHCSENPDKAVNDMQFRYPGPKPATKEQTILMLADSLEAASKSLKNPTGQDIDNLEEKITSYKIKEGQLDESELSFYELQKVRKVMRKVLRSMLHVRIEYPEEVK